MDKQKELQKWLDDDRYVRVKDLQEKTNINIQSIYKLLKRHKVKHKKRIRAGTGGGLFVFYDKQKCNAAIAEYEATQEEIHKMQGDLKYVRPQELSKLWCTLPPSTSSFLRSRNIKPVKIYNAGLRGGKMAFYDRAECERARPFINQPEQKEVEKPMNPPEPKQQTPDIIPADTIDSYTLKQLESELQSKGVEFTPVAAEIIRGSDTPELKQVAKMLDGEADSIILSGTKLSEIAEQLREVKCDGKNELPDEMGNPRVIWLSLSERIVFEFLRHKTTYTPKRDIVEHFKAMRQPIDDSVANRAVWAAISVLRDMRCLDAQDGCFMVNCNYASTEAVSSKASNRKSDPSAIDIGLENGKPINDKIKKSGWWTVGIISEVSGKSESWLRSHLPLEDCLIAYGNDKLIKAWMPKRVIQWLNDRNIFVQGWGDMKKYPKNGMRKYKPVFDKIAFDMASENKSDIEISKRLDVTIATFNKYKKEIPSFANAINSGMTAYLSSITSPQSKTESVSDNGVRINQDLKDKLRFMAMADNVDLAAKLESIITAAWIMGNYENK